MYKMYNTQLDDQSDDDKNSLNSSFWSDGEKQEDEEEEVERVIDKEDSRPVAEAEDSRQETSEEEKPELFVQEDFHRESLEDDDDEERCSSSSDSPAPSLMTSGYGTYRPEEQEGGGCGDNHTMTEFDQDSRGDLSEMRDDEEDDRSLCSFGGFYTETTREPDYHETRPSSVSADEQPEASVKYSEDLNPEEDVSRADEQKVKDVTDATSEEKHQHVTEAEDEQQPEALEEEQQDLKEHSNAESEDPDESSSNKDIRFIDSKADFRWMTYKKMCEEWEGNLRQKKGKRKCCPPRNSTSVWMKGCLKEISCLLLLSGRRSLMMTSVSIYQHE